MWKSKSCLLTIQTAADHKATSLFKLSTLRCLCLC